MEDEYVLYPPTPLITCKDMACVRGCIGKINGECFVCQQQRECFLIKGKPLYCKDCVRWRNKL